MRQPRSRRAGYARKSPRCDGRGRFNEAARLARAAIETPGAGKSAAQAYFVLASALYLSRDADGAIAALKNVLLINPEYSPEYSPALAGLGEIALVSVR